MLGKTLLFLIISSIEMIFRFFVVLSFLILFGIIFCFSQFIIRALLFMNFIHIDKPFRLDFLAVVFMVCTYRFCFFF